MEYPLSKDDLEFLLRFIAAARRHLKDENIDEARIDLDCAATRIYNMRILPASLVKEILGDLDA